MRKVSRWLIASLALVLFWVALLPATLGGMTSYVMVDGKSMEPLLYTGDLAITSKLVEHKAGDLVVFDIGGGGLVIHRLVERDSAGLWITKGDNKPAVDPWAIADDEIIGKYLFTIPGAGAKIAWIKSRPLALGLGAGFIAIFLHLPFARLIPRRWRRAPKSVEDAKREDIKAVLALTIAGSAAGVLAVVGLIRYGLLLSPTGLITLAACVSSGVAAILIYQETRTTTAKEEERERAPSLV